MTLPYRHAAGLVGLWLFLAVSSLCIRFYIPIDETRVVTVAWNMWLRGDLLVPHLNGEPYSHKPPLLYWLINLGWAIFDVNDWWPRVVPSLFSLASAWLAWRIASRLWPQQPLLAQLAPLILLGSLLWTLFSTAVMFDMLVAFFTLLGMTGILIVWQDNSRKGWLLLGAAIGGGLLAKGPTILLQLLPLAVLAPWWGKSRPRRWLGWYSGILGSVLLGTLIALAWAIPAGMRGGEEYQHAIFWGQTANRLVDSFAHKHTYFWYLPLLPVMFFPWFLWAPVWRGALRFRNVMAEPGMRFALAWLVPVFLAFSLISGKQMHYLLPVFPAFALLAARAVILADDFRPMDDIPAALVVFGIGVGLIYLPYYAAAHPLAPWVEAIPEWGGAGLMAVAVLLFLLRSRRDSLPAAWRMTLFSTLAVTLFFVAVIPSTGTAYDVRPISARLKQLEDAGLPLAHAGKYPGTFDFIGRLRNPPEPLHQAQLTAWFEKHPDGRAIVYFDRNNPPGNSQTEFMQNYRGVRIGIVNRQQWASWPSAHSTEVIHEAPRTGVE